MELRRYIVVFENAGESGWGAYVPDLPGCTAAAPSFDEIVRAAQQSIELWIEDAEASGEAIPEPSTEAFAVSVAV